MKKKLQEKKEKEKRLTFLHPGPALKQATLEMMKNDEERKKKRQRKTNNEQNEEKRQQYLKEQAQKQIKEKEQAEKA